MPVSMVCESTANVNAALRESLSVNCSSAAVADDSKTGSTPSPLTAAGGCSDDVETLQSKLVASAKCVLMSKIEYEEVNNYGQAVLDTFKSKYILLKPAPATATNGGITENGRKSPAAAALYNNGHNNSANYGTKSHTTEKTSGGKINGSSSSSSNNSSSNGNNNNVTGNPAKRSLSSNSVELQQPKRVLYPRDQVRIGWKNSPRKWQIGSGFLNMGNTCYLNSTLQALFHVPSMANWLISDIKHLENCESNDSSCIICAMAKTLVASQSNQSAIRPYFICSKLKLICKTMAIGRQEDAHEFLRYLVDAMERSYLQRIPNYKDLDQYSKETTPLNQILGGYLKSAVRCLGCSHVSVTFQHFQDLLLDIRKGDTIEEAMDCYFARERLEDMGYKCESCKKKVSATKQFSLERAPIVLCIQLKRFSVLGTKLNKQITLKTRLDLSKYASHKPSSQLTYRLVSMITHLGATQHCGHYTAIGLTESGTYYCYDDSSVRPISVQSVCNTNAYVIFYEMDSPAAARLDVSNCSSANAKENYQKSNGHVLNGLTTLSNITNVNRSKSPQRVIGPELPPGGIAAYNNAYINGSGSGSSSKLAINRQHAIPTSNSKLMIHFKNTDAKTNTTSKTTYSDSTSAAICGSNSAFPQNGIVLGTGKFQNTLREQSALAGAAHKGETDAASNGSESPAFSDCEDEVVSSSTTKNQRLLPDMPNLLVDGNPNTTTNLETPRTNGTTKAKVLEKVKSLVPYESESDDNAAVSPNSASPLKKSSNKRYANGESGGKSANKRSYSDSSGDDVDMEPPFCGKKSADSRTTNGAPMAANQQSKLKQKTDVIDEIFNSHKRNTNNAITTNGNQHYTNNGSSNGNGNNSPQKHKQNKLPASSQKCTMDDDGADSDSEIANKQKQAKRPFKRSQSTPPSPPMVVTKTGIWQVTQIQPVAGADTGNTEQKTPKNPKNPFATKTPELFAKRPKMHNGNEKRVFAGNGYQRDNTESATVDELLKQSHRGYGAPVLTWNGTQNEVEKELLAEAREQRQREWEEADEQEMDRGRQKKTSKPKLHRDYNDEYMLGYNPFQEQDNQQRRWKRGGGGGGHHRLHYGHFRHQFQRNKFKFNSYNFNKNHQQRHKSNGGNHQQKRHA